MLNSEKNSYFTAGELANLFGISKQALLYYDKVNLLSPDYVSENGYRYYSIKQYLDLEIIVKLRALNIALADIKKYLQERTKDDFLTLVNKKKDECTALIQENERILKSLDALQVNATPTNTIIFDQPLLTIQEKRYLCVTPVNLTDDAKERMALFTHHAEDVYCDEKAPLKQVGWVISQEDLFHNDIPNKTKAYFSFAPFLPDEDVTAENVLPAGLYIEVYFQGTYYTNADKLAKMLAAFLENTSLKPIGDIYILPMENNLYYNDTTKFLNKIFLRVAKV